MVSTALREQLTDNLAYDSLSSDDVSYAWAAPDSLACYR